MGKTFKDKRKHFENYDRDVKSAKRNSKSKKKRRKNQEYYGEMIDKGLYGI